MNLQALRWQNRRPNAATDRFVSGVGVIALVVMILAMAPELPLVLIGAMLLSGLIVGAYFAPLIVAICRGHRNELAIGVLNMLLGWTIVGWVAALVWACRHQPTQRFESRMDPT